jgi:hypothetical protein
MNRLAPNIKPALVVWLAPLVLLAGLLVFSQSVAWGGDEGFHLLAAQLILAGKRPYLDFFYQHAPLFIYLEAVWMSIFGDTWRSAHVFSSLLTGGCIFLVAGYVYRRIPRPGWRLPAAVAASLLVGLHILVIRQGTIGQSYALCLFLNAVAFRLVITAAIQPGSHLPLLAGLCSGAAGASLLLAAPVSPLMLLWMLRYNQGGTRARKGVLFLGGALIPFLPLLWLAFQSPRQVFFNVVEYHLFYRQAGYDDIVKWNFSQVASVFITLQGLVLVSLAAAGLLCVGEPDKEASQVKAELRLCAWLVVGLGTFLCIPRPTFAIYFVLLIPFLSILAAMGTYAIGTRFGPSAKPVWLVLPLVGLFMLGLARAAYRERSQLYLYWYEIDAIAREINRVTRPDQLVYAHDSIYFATRRLPPNGLENAFAPDLDLPPALASSLHVVRRSQIDEWLAGGRFATVWMEFPRIKALGLNRIYKSGKKADARSVHMVDDYYILWDVAPASTSPLSRDQP